MGNKSSLELTLCFLLTTALCLEAAHIKITVYCPPEKMTWTEARRYCQRNHIDLVTWNTVDRVWLICSEELQPVCYDDNLVLVKKNKTWEQALQHCKAMTTPCADSPESCVYTYKVLSLHNRRDYDYVRERIYRATTDEVWIGLRYLGGQWVWLNGEEPDHQGMLPECPSQLNNCGTLSKHGTNHWPTRDCSERRNFICCGRMFILETLSKILLLLLGSSDSGAEL
ncbi:unnamed protein product [Pleuronectes platessa]|uniref:C-type lectin domain-containing protein n=1 Tax=Pleuronectes platessa TaxID=8262 RepID=A0A9N7TX79_PLEPL|nr:unnamed protein product [Pleuronectes platessa]